MTIPAPDQEVPLKMLIPILAEMLGYCMTQACQDPLHGDVDYDPANNLLGFEYHPSELDREMFEMLIGVETIWIIQDASTEGAS